MGNDGHCFGLSESIGGSGQGFDSVFGAIIGTGVGAGYCVGGQLLSTFNGIAGEWGHLALPCTLQQQYHKRRSANNVIS